MHIINYNSKYYPEQLRKIENPPKTLYANGNIELLNTYSISIIGSRACSKYGMKNANTFAKDLAYQNITITSGMAIGIDTIAHNATIEANGKTIAVLPCGFDNIFPKENICLYKNIIDTGGLVISEYSPSKKANSNYFLERNRIVSGLSIGILVIEAAYRSGTSVTASLAKKQNKKIFCIPHNLGDKHGVGTNRLIKNGAFLVTCAKDIIDKFEFLDYNPTLGKDNDILTNNQVDPKYLDIYNLLIGPPLNIAQICNKSKQDAQFVNSALLMLELNGNIIKNKEGYQANVF